MSFTYLSFSGSASQSVSAGTIDFTVARGTATFDAGQTTATIAVPVVGDTLDEPDETFAVTLSNPANASLGTARSATGTINNDDDPPEVSVGAASGDEGSNVEFTVTLSAASSFNVTVTWSATAEAGNSATAGTDFTAATGRTLTIPADRTTGTFTVAASNDALDEDDETFTVTLSSATNATLARATATGTINDDDPLPRVTVHRWINHPPGSEIDYFASGDEGSPVRFPVTLSAASGRPVTVNYRTLASDSIPLAQPGTDYTEPAADSQFTFQPGEVFGQIEIATTGNSIADGDRYFDIQLSLPPSADATIRTARVTGTINDDEPDPSFSVDAVQEKEDAGTIDFTVNLSPVSARRHTVNWRASTEAADTAAARADYAAGTGMLVFEPGETSKTIPIALVDDNTDEVDETFTVTLTSPSAGAALGQAKAAGTITDDDEPPAVSVASASAPENSATMRFRVTLAASSGRPVAVGWATADGTANAGSDYTAASGVLTFNAGETSQQVEVTLTDDGVHDDRETFTVTLSGPAGLTDVILARPAATATITDDDGPPALAVADAAEVVEGHDGARPTMTFMVTMTGDPSAAVTVDYQTRGGTATAGTDYEPKRGSLTFAPDESGTSKMITVTVRGDTEREGDETLMVRLSNGRSAGERVQILQAGATGTIRDDEPGVSIRPLSLTIGEGAGAATYQVQLYTEPPGSVTVTISSDNPDVTATPDRLTFTAADYNVAQPVAVSAAEDDDASNDRARLVHAVTGYGAVTQGPTVTVTVNDDERRTGGGPGGGEPEEPQEQAEPAGFADVSPGSFFAPSINALHAAGVTRGCSSDPLRFCPDASVTRAQMASFLARALDLPAPRRIVRFVDVDRDSVHAPSISVLFFAGITTGCSIEPLQYCPDEPVTRAAMATFLTRALDL